MYRTGANSALHADVGLSLPMNYDDVVRRDQLAREIQARQPKTVYEKIRGRHTDAPRRLLHSRGMAIPELRNKNQNLRLDLDSKTPKTAGRFFNYEATATTEDREVDLAGMDGGPRRGRGGERLMKEYRKGTMPSTLWHPITVVDTRDPKDVRRWQRPDLMRANTSIKEDVDGEVHDRTDRDAHLFRTEYVRRKNNSGYEARTVLDQGERERLVEIRARFEAKIKAQARDHRRAERQKKREERKMLATLRALGLGV
eukprot:g7471.t1